MQFMSLPSLMDYFEDFEQIWKTSFGETPWLTGHHITPLVTLFFYYHHVTYRMPCHVGGHLVILPWVQWIWESIFLSQVCFALHSFLLVSRPPWGRQFNLNISRASCWSSKQSPSPAICFTHNNLQKSYSR